MNQSHLNSYRTANIETTDQGKLILIVYDWAIRYCKIAKEKILENEIDGRTYAINKVQNAITELMTSLNMDKGEEIAQNLYKLYDYMNRRLVEVNTKKDEGALTEVLGYLTDLRDAWVTAIENVRNIRNPQSVKTPESGIAIVG